MNPATGVDAAGRGTLTKPYKTFGYAFNTIPAYTPLSKGYKILIAKVRTAEGVLCAGGILHAWVVGGGGGGTLCGQKRGLRRGGRSAS